MAGNSTGITMSPQEKLDQLADWEQEYFDRRLEELSAGQNWKRSDLYHKINCELDEIRRKRNEY